MKTLSNLIAVSSLLLFISSCKKEAIPTTGTLTSISNSSELDAGNGDCDRRWFGLYANGINPDDTITQKSLIKNGVAQLPAVNWYNYHTGIDYNIPLCHEISADCITFEVRLKNPSDGSGAIYDYEVALQLYGSEKLYGSSTFSEIYFVANSSAQNYSHIWIGNEQLWNLPELVHYFGDYETLTLQIKDNVLSIFREGSLVKAVPYESTHLGRLRRIGIGFKGTGTADWVKLYNSKSGTQIMQEDFNVDGKSNVIWF